MFSTRNPLELNVSVGPQLMTGNHALSPSVGKSTLNWSRFGDGCGGEGGRILKKFSQRVVGKLCPLPLSVTGLHTPGDDSRTQHD